MKKHLLTIVLAVISMAATAQYIDRAERKSVDNIPVSIFAAYQHQLFNFDWKFQLGTQPGAENPAFDDSNWRTIDLPHDFQFEQPWPDAYSCYVATTLNHLGLLHWKTDQFNIAETELKEALKIHRNLVEDNPDAYLADLAMTLNNLGIVHKYLNLWRIAEDEYNEALEIRQKLAHDNPDAYSVDVAKTLFNKAKLLMLDELRKDNAKQACQEALDILKVMVQKAPQRFNKSVDKVQELLDYINKL